MIPARDEAIERAREVLRILVSLSDVSQREVKRRLVEAKSGADVSRLLQGPLDPKLRHVLDICRILGMHRGEFFAITYPRPAQPSQLLLMVREVLISSGDTLAVQPGGPHAVEGLKRRRPKSRIAPPCLNVQVFTVRAWQRQQARLWVP